MSTKPDLQLAFVKWGDRYGTDWLNRHIRAIKRHATCSVRFVCITDDTHVEAFDPSVEVVPFPRFSAPMDYLKQGTRLKLSIFAPGVLIPDVPAIYLDLDSSVIGDVARLRDYLSDTPNMNMLSGHFLQWWRVQPYITRYVGEKYYHANGSAIGFMPHKFEWLFDQFNTLIKDKYGGDIPKYLKVDDRFISYHCRDRLRVFPKDLIVKYSDEYCAPLHVVESVRKRLPWTIARRNRLVAVSFPGISVKPDQLAALNPSDEVRYKWLKSRWEQDQLRSYWTEPLPEPHAYAS